MKIIIDSEGIFESNILDRILFSIFFQEFVDCIQKQGESQYDNIFLLDRGKAFNLACSNSIIWPFARDGNFFSEMILLSDFLGSLDLKHFISTSNSIVPRLGNKKFYFTQSKNFNYFENSPFKNKINRFIPEYGQIDLGKYVIKRIEFDLIDRSKNNALINLLSLDISTNIIYFDCSYKFFVELIESHTDFLLRKYSGRRLVFVFKTGQVLNFFTQENSQIDYFFLKSMDPLLLWNSSNLIVLDKKIYDSCSNIIDLENFQGRVIDFNDVANLILNFKELDNLITFSKSRKFLKRNSTLVFNLDKLLEDLFLSNPISWAKFNYEKFGLVSNLEFIYD